MIKLNGVEVIPTIFPDKTSQVWKLPEGLIKEDRNEVVWDFEHEGELIQVAQVKALLKAYAIRSFTSLYLPYLPYGRQDKEVTNETTFALKVFIEFLRAMYWDEVKVFDPHSALSLYSFVNWRTIEPVKEIQAAIDACKPDVVVFPDEGAGNRYKHIIPVDLLRIYAYKNRNQSSGEIVSLELDVMFSDFGPWSILIVDDICDGGMTFIKLAELLYSKGATEVHLYVSHGIFSKGLQVLRDAGISRIFTKDGEVI